MKETLMDAETGHIITETWASIRSKSIKATMTLTSKEIWLASITVARHSNTIYEYNIFIQMLGLDENDMHTLQYSSRKEQ